MLPMFKRIVEEYKLMNLIKEYGGCQQCGWCCKNERLTIFCDDIERLGSLLKPENIVRTDEMSATFNLPCPFIVGNRCGVYNKRSGVCKTYPFLFHYIGLLTISFDCPLGKRMYNDIIKYCETNGVKIAGDEEKTDSMKMIDRMVNDRGLNSGEGHSSKIVNIPFEMFKDFLKWRKKHKKNKGVIRK